MNKNLLFTLVALVFSTVSCKNESPDNPTNDNTINIVASIAPLSRAPQLGNDGSGSFTKGDMMSLFITKENDQKLSVDYSYGVDNTSWGELGLTEETKKISLSAVYPQQKKHQEGIFEFNTLTADEKDLLLADPQELISGSDHTVYLTFRHAMHKINFKFTCGNGVTEDDIQSLSFVLNAKTSCMIDAAEAVIKELKSDKGDYESTGDKATFYLVPQPTSDITLNITVGGKSEQIALDKLLQQLDTPHAELKGGQCTSLTLKINSNSITIESGTIGGWVNQDTIDGEVTIG
ncbi:fimbrillin family protein [Phocaeicola sp. HCN-40430]|uniref:fimbrillin family protein n=1 Tax=Phocaeicola sp. HCN-40430 TaxID=3134664 RepID=UPI0030BECA34